MLLYLSSMYHQPLQQHTERPLHLNTFNMILIETFHTKEYGIIRMQYQGVFFSNITIEVYNKWRLWHHILIKYNVSMGFFYWIEVNSTIPVVIFAAGVLNLINAQYNVEFFFLNDILKNEKVLQIWTFD